MWMRILLLLVLNSHNLQDWPSTTDPSTSFLVDRETHSVVGIRLTWGVSFAFLFTTSAGVTVLSGSYLVSSILSRLPTGGFTSEMMATRLLASVPSFPSTTDGIVVIRLTRQMGVDLSPFQPFATFKANWLLGSLCGAIPPSCPPVTFKTGEQTAVRD